MARLALAATVLGLAACGGGGGGGGGGGNGGGVVDPAPQLGLVELKVTDRYDTAVAGALVKGPQGDAITDAQGITLVATESPGASAPVRVSRASFVEQSLVVTSVPGRLNQVRVTLDRETAPAGASLATRSGVLPSLGASGQQLSFEIELVVLDGDARADASLTRADFALRPCTPDPATERADCVRGPATADDAAFTPVASTPERLGVVAGNVARPYATALLLDQSGSIRDSDPTGARLYATKRFLGGLGDGDQALLAAFAGNPGALLPSVPLTAYGPFRGLSQAISYHATLDSLAGLVGGNTPLYDAIDTLRLEWLDSATLVDGIGKAMVVVTDGADTTCGDPADCRARRERSILGAQEAGVRVFALGLSAGADIAALGELATRTGGALLYADSAEQLLPLYGSVGRLMSLSLPTYRLRWTVRADAPGAFRSGQTLLGRVQVSTAGGRFDVPFAVAIP